MGLDQYQLNLALARRLQVVISTKGWRSDLVSDEPDVILNVTHDKLSPVWIEVIISNQKITLRHSISIKTVRDLTEPGHEEWFVKKLTKTLKPFTW